MEVPFSRPAFKGHEGEAVAQAIASGWVSQGPRVREFEAAFAERVGAAEAVATSNCTTALQLPLSGAGAGRGEGLIVPSLSSTPPATGVGKRGAPRVFAESAPPTFTLAPAPPGRAIPRRTKAIMPV